VILVANRVGDDEAWSGRCALAVPDSRLAALLLARGRTPGGPFGAAMARVAAVVEEQR
jgi:hypothetical protein